MIHLTLNKIHWLFFFFLKRWQRSVKEQVFTMLLSSELFGYSVFFFFFLNGRFGNENDKCQEWASQFSCSLKSTPPAIYNAYLLPSLNCAGRWGQGVKGPPLPERPVLASRSLGLPLTWGTGQSNTGREKRRADHTLEEWAHRREAHSRRLQLLFRGRNHSCCTENVWELVPRMGWGGGGRLGARTEALPVSHQGAGPSAWEGMRAWSQEDGWGSPSARAWAPLRRQQGEGSIVVVHLL